MSVLRRAAVTEDSGGERLLFVHAGIDPARPLMEQGDNFWWGAATYNQLYNPYQAFYRVFRGFDPAGKGATLDGYAVTLDARTNSHGTLIAALIEPSGHIVDIIKADPAKS